MRGSKKKRSSNIHEAIDYPIDHIEKLGLLIDEVELQELASKGQLNKRFSIKARNKQKLPPDSVAKEDFVKAPPMPLSRNARIALIRSSNAHHLVRRGK